MNFKAKILLLGICSITILVSSCKKDNPADWTPATTPVTSNGKADLFKVAVSGDTTTHNWQPTDTIGIMMQTLVNSDTISNTVLAENEKYIPGASGEFVPLNNDAIVYPADGTLVNFTAYYPYRAGVDSIYKLNITNQSNPAAIDLLYAGNATNFSAQSTTTPYLQFEHQLAKIELNIEKPAGLVADLTGMEVTVKQQSATADFNLKTGSFSNQAVSDIVPQLKPVVQGTANTGLDTTYLATFFVLPEKLEGKLIEIKLASGRIFDWAFPSGTTDAAKGQNRSFDVSLQPTERVIFSEGFGTADASANPTFTKYTGYDNGVGLLITGNGQVRPAGNGMTTNTGRFANTEQNFVISNINTDGFSGLKLQFDIVATNAGTAQPVDIKNLVSVNYNGVTGLESQIPSTISNSSSQVFTLSIDLSAIPVSASGTLEIIGNKGYTSAAPQANAFFRIDNVKLLGEK